MCRLLLLLFHACITVAIPWLVLLFVCFRDCDTMGGQSGSGMWQNDNNQVRAVLSHGSSDSSNGFMQVMSNTFGLFCIGDVLYNMRAAAPDLHIGNSSQDISWIWNFEVAVSELKGSCGAF